MKKTIRTILLLGFVTLLFNASSGLAQSVQVIPLVGANWKYNDFFNLDGEEWWLPGYDDTTSDWKGPAPSLLSNDSGNANIGPLIRTPIKSPQAAGEGGVFQHTYYFRHKFTYSGGPVLPHTLMNFAIRIDDGASFWLNGSNVYNHNVTGPIQFTTQATLLANQGNGDANTNELFSLDAAAAGLIQGENTIAVTVHQIGGNSSDVTFGVQLDIVPPRFPTILSNSEPADRVVAQNRPTTLRVFAEASPAPTYQWFYSATVGGPFNPILDATNSSYAIASMQQIDEGYYYCTVANVLGSVDSRTAFVDYTEDVDPPLLLSVIGSQSFDAVIAQFNERVDTLTASDPFNWQISDGANNYAIDETRISFIANGTAIVLGLAVGTVLPENTAITVFASGILDETDINVLAETNLTFQTYVSGCSGFLFEAFNTASTGTNQGNAVALLTTHPDYPNNPRDVARIPSFDSRHAYTDDSHEQFGARVRGLFIPTLTGPWVFYHRSDDAGELWVNPTGPSSAGKIRVAVESGCCGNFMPQGDPRTSVPINLVAGQPYYVEALYKEGGGGDWLKVAAGFASDPPPASGANGSVNPEVIQGGAGPAGILSHITIATHPADRAVIAGQVAAFSVALSQDVPACFQWKAGGTDIPGAVGPNYRRTTVLDDNGLKISVAVSLMGGTSLLSTEATLSVSNDVTSATVLSVTQNLEGNILVSYSEPIDPASGTNAANYLIDGVNPTRVLPSGNSAVALVPEVFIPQCPLNHTVQISNVKDLYNNITTTNVPLTLNNILLTPISASKTWKYHDGGTDLGGGWFATGFDDSTWSNSAPTFAFPAGEVIQAGYPVRTTLAGVRPTTYFRTHFNLATDPSSVTNLQLNVILDDGGIFYLNGQELRRIRMNAGDPAFDTLSNAGSPSDPPQIVEIFSAPPGALLFGDNVIAARVHQSSATSSDTVFALGLVAQVDACTPERPRLRIALNGNGTFTLTATGPGGVIYRAPSLDGPWSGVGAAPQTLPLPTAPGQEFYEIRP